MDKDKSTRPEAYPKPTETDSQLQNQPEFIDQQPNDFHDKSISDIDSDAVEKASNDSENGLKEE